ncbi:hypothetical protein D3C71_1647560 [compost metagenome]
MPPAWLRHRLEKSSARNCGFCSSALNSVFTPGSRWNGRFFSTPTNLAMSRGLGIRLRLEPWRMASRHSVSAKIWYSGSAATLCRWRRSGRRVSAGSNQASACSVAAMMLRWVRIAPLDRPVVPPVYCRKAIESSVAGLGRSVRCAPSANASGKVVTTRPPVSGKV